MPWRSQSGGTLSPKMAGSDHLTVVVSGQNPSLCHRSLAARKARARPTSSAHTRTADKNPDAIPRNSADIRPATTNIVNGATGFLLKLLLPAAQHVRTNTQMMRRFGVLVTLLRYQRHCLLLEVLGVAASLSQFCSLRYGILQPQVGVWI